MTGLGGGRHEDWEACSGNLSEWESTWLAPGMGDICALTGGQRKVVNLASVSRLTRNKNHSKSRVFSEDTKVRLPLLLKLRVACDDRKLPLLGFCHQTVSQEESKSQRFFKLSWFNSLSSPPHPHKVPFKVFVIVFKKCPVAFFFLEDLFFHSPLEEEQLKRNFKLY